MAILIEKKLPESPPDLKTNSKLGDTSISHVNNDIISGNRFVKYANDAINKD